LLDKLGKNEVSNFRGNDGEREEGKTQNEIFIKPQKKIEPEIMRLCVIREFHISLRTTNFNKTIL
jgi:hypothetical protein